LKDGDEDEVMRDAQRAVISARRAIHEAQRALDRAEMQFKLAGIDPEELLQRFEKDADPADRQEVDRLLAEAMTHMAKAPNQAVNQSNLSNSGNSSARRIRFHV
jgi:hypothetical protein